MGSQTWVSVRSRCAAACRRAADACRGGLRHRLPLVVAVVGIAAATLLSLFPRWDRRWREHPDTRFEGGDVVRAFILTGPAEPADVGRYDGQDERGRTLWGGSHIYSFTTSVRWGELVGVWVVIAAPFLIAAGLVRRERGRS